METLIQAKGTNHCMRFPAIQPLTPAPSCTCLPPSSTCHCQDTHGLASKPADLIFTLFCASQMVWQAFTQMQCTPRVHAYILREHLMRYIQMMLLNVLAHASGDCHVQAVWVHVQLYNWQIFQESSKQGLLLILKAAARQTIKSRYSPLCSFC